MLVGVPVWPHLARCLHSHVRICVYHSPVRGCCGLQEHYVEVTAVGYSCVLFSLIVVTTSMSKEYCPLPGVPKACLPTWKIPLPFFGSDVTLPFNASPFLLLVAMHYLVPKASFVGHLAGIVMGFPLLWGGMNWCSLPMLARLCAVAIVLRARVLKDTPFRLGPGATASAWQGVSPGHVLGAASAPVSPGRGGGRSKRLLALAVLWTAVVLLRTMSLTWCVLRISNGLTR